MRCVVCHLFLTGFNDESMLRDVTAAHVKLNMALTNNKRAIMHLLGRPKLTVDDMVTLGWLRDEASRLVYELSHEIQCEQNIVFCNRARKCRHLRIIRSVHILSLLLIADQR
jgi:hypothetical protein